jgi:NADH-quinone oxidoreductase subunit G
MAYGPGQSRFPVESKFHTDKRVPLGDLIMLDRERCIQCARCIRFQDELADDHVLGFSARGRGMEIVSLSDPAFDSKFSGNTIDICPVGALTSRDFRFGARVWEVNDVSSVCAHCSVGCNILIGERDHEIKRVVPRENEAVNAIWLCDKGRFAHHFATATDRLTVPLIRKDSTLQPASWNEALDLVASKFEAVKKKSGAAALGGLAGDRVSNEDLYLFQKLFRKVLGSGNLDHRIGWSASNQGTDLVRLYGAGVDTNLGALDKNVTALVVGADPEEEQPVIRVRLTRSVRNFGLNLIVANGRVTKLAKYASQAMIYRYGTETFFLLGIVRTILDEGLANQEFVSKRVNNLDDFTHSLAAYPVERCAGECGISADSIRNAARAFAKAPNGLVLYGREGMLAQARDPAFASAVAALLLITGHVGRLSNGLIALYPHNNSTGAIDFGILPDHEAGRVSALNRGLGADEMTAGKVGALYVMACDPAAESGFVKPDLLVVQDLFMTETARLADVVLPAQSFAERDGTVTNTERRVQLFRAAVKAAGDSKPDWWTIEQIAKRMGANWKHANVFEITSEIAAEVELYAGVTPTALATNVIATRPAYGQGNPSSEPTSIAMGELETVSSGKQWTSVAERGDVRFELAWNEPAQRTTIGGRQYYLVVARTLYDRGTLVSRTAIVQPRVPAPFVEFNSHDAEEIGIGQGAAVRVLLGNRAVSVSARVDGRVPPGVVLMPNNLDGTAALPAGMWVQVERA